MSVECAGTAPKILCSTISPLTFQLQENRKPCQAALLSMWYSLPGISLRKGAGGGGNPPPLGAWRSADFWKLFYPEGQHPLAALGSFTCRSPLPPSWDCVLCRGDQALEVHGGAGCWHILCSSLCPGYSAGKYRILRVNGGDTIAAHQGLRGNVRHLFIFLSI